MLAVLVICLIVTLASGALVYTSSAALPPGWAEVVFVLALMLAVLFLLALVARSALGLLWDDPAETPRPPVNTRSPTLSAHPAPGAAIPPRARGTSRGTNHAHAPHTESNTMASLVTGLFKSATAANRAIEALRRSGFTDADISILTSQSSTSDAFGIESGSKVGEGTAIGAGVGGGLGALIVGLTAVGVVASGGLGLVAAGPIVAALAGAGAGAATGGLIGGLIGLGIPEHEAKYFDNAIQKGGVLVGVKAEGDKRDTARTVFRDNGAEDISRA